MQYRIVFEAAAAETLRRIRDTRVREAIQGRIERLAEHPEQQGKPLRGHLHGLWSVRAAKRYRIVYRVERERVVVIIVYLGPRDWVYEEVLWRRQRGDL
jgi:mRNA interferase RelE/StbE